ncbi:MAG TPA: PEGA domain-containing protein [Candidatus Methylomirabilis sp.]|nr:PEGA domain-containing protein [Candidatus Methylomirabilis sp.]
MSRIPFHRRALLWVFIVAFVAIAPTVVFYTAGYRWNPKKGAIERNGTLIIDTVPAGASITLNGERLVDRSPVTLQNVAPGTYTIRLERDGFHPWEKTLDVRPELVTFVNNVFLWPDEAPALVTNHRAFAISVSPNERMLAYLSENGTGTRLTFYDVRDAIGQTVFFNADAPTGSTRITWNRASSAVLMEDGEAAWVVLRGGSRTPVRMPPGLYRWDDGRLIGTNGSSRLEYVIATEEIRRTALPPLVVDEDDAYRLVQTTTTGRLFVTERSNGAKRYELPDGTWKFADRVDGWVFLKSQDALLGFDPDAARPFSVRLPASGVPQTQTRSGKTTMLSWNGGEGWFYRLEDDQSELFVRKSSALRGLAWHRLGYDVFYATSQEIIAMNLDPRDGRRETILAAFDEVFGMAVTKKAIYVAGSRNGERGVWSVRTE